MRLWAELNALSMRSLKRVGGLEGLERFVAESLKAGGLAKENITLAISRKAFLTWDNLTLGNLTTW